MCENGLCEGTGYCLVFKAGVTPDSAKLVRVGEFPPPGTEVFDSFIPCSCSKGIAINDRREQNHPRMHIGEKLLRRLHTEFSYPVRTRPEEVLNQTGRAFAWAADHDNKGSE